MEKKKETISLKTDLKDVEINSKLRSWVCQNFTEIINQPTKKSKKKIGFRNLNISFSKSRTNTQSFNETFTSDINYDKFSTNELLTSEDSPKSIKSNKSISFKMLMEQDYSSYVSLLKKMYPSFKFNHYSNYSKQCKSKSSNENNKIKEEVSYTPNKLFDSLALTDNYLLSPSEFTINKDILEKKDIDILELISHDFDLKGGMIEGEINRILSSNYKLIYDYVKHNMQVGKEIDNYVIALNGKKLSKEKLAKAYVHNTASLLLKGRRKQILIQIKKKLSDMKMLYESMNKLHSIEARNVKEFSEMVNTSKGVINKIRGWDKTRKTKIVNICEKELMTYENKNEEKLLEQFAMSVLKLFNMCMRINSPPLINSARNDLKPSCSFNLDKTENDMKMNNTYASEDFLFENENNNIEFILIYNNTSAKSLLITLLEIVNIIIKDNVDIFSIIERLERIFKSLIIRIFDSVQKTASLSNKELLYIISNAFVIVISNYNYLINLFLINFGLMPKIFSELTKTINSEMTKLIKALVSSAMQETIVNGSSKNFIDKIKDVYPQTESFVKFVTADWNDFIGNVYNEFLISFYDKKSNELYLSLEKEEWTQYSEIDSNYQNKINYILKQESKISNEEKIDCLLIGEEKYKLVKLTLEIIDFIYEVSYIIREVNNESIKEEYIKKCYILSLSLLQKTRDIIMNNQDGKIKENKVITEKEISLFCSHCRIMNHILQNFLSMIPHKDIQDIFIEINQSCKEALSELLSQLREATINQFKELDFANYPTFKEKEYNSYIKRFSRMKKLYDNMIGAFSNNDIIELFTTVFETCFNSMDEIVKEKCRIEDDLQLKQFRTEMVYMKKVLKMFELINVEPYREKIEGMSKFVNPKKLPKKKKKENKEITEDKDSISTSNTTNIESK